MRGALQQLWDCGLVFLGCKTWQDYVLYGQVDISMSSSMHSEGVVSIFSKVEERNRGRTGLLRAYFTGFWHSLIREDTQETKLSFELCILSRTVCLMLQFFDRFLIQRC